MLKECKAAGNKNPRFAIYIMSPEGGGPAIFLWTRYGNSDAV
jgi:hypothetical protein